MVAVPEIYHRIEPAGTVLGFDDEGKARGQADAEATPTADFDADVAAALDWLDERCSNVGAAGHCTGGHIAFRAAFDARVRATVCWYPTGLQDGKLGADKTDSLERAGDISGDILLIFGTRDPHTPQPGRETVRAGWRPPARASSGASTRPSTPSGATSARATTPRRPTAPSARPSTFLRRLL